MHEMRDAEATLAGEGEPCQVRYDRGPWGAGAAKLRIDEWRECLWAAVLPIYSRCHKTMRGDSSAKHNTIAVE